MEKGHDGGITMTQDGELAQLGAGADERSSLASSFSSSRR